MPPALPHDDDAPPVGASSRAAIDAIVRELVDVRRQLAVLQAREIALLSAAADIANAERELSPPGRQHDLALRAIAADIAAAVRASDRTIQRRIDDSSRLTTDFPATVAALSEAQIDRAHAFDMLAAGCVISDPLARGAFEQAALAVAERETPARARPVIRLLAQHFDPEPFADRHTRAIQQRRVWVEDRDDGVSAVIALVSSVRAHAVLDRLTQYARIMDDHGAEGELARTVDQRRADAFADLLLTGHATAEISAASIPEAEAIIARVQVTIPATVLTRRRGVDDVGTGGGAPDHCREPATLDGCGPIASDDARRLAGIAPGWDRLFVDPVRGTVACVDRYRPSEEQRRFLRARDAHCRFPGCRMPVSKSDIDHTRDAARGGPTTVSNLAHLCRRHHVMKHQTAWTVHQRLDGALVWTSPTGREHVDVPHRMLAPPAGGPPLEADRGSRTAGNGRGGSGVTFSESGETGTGDDAGARAKDPCGGGPDQDGGSP